MNHHLSPLERLVALAAEAESILARGLASHDIRHACALARGYLELARQYDEPLKAEDVDRLMDRMRSALAESQLGQGDDGNFEPLERERV